MKKLNIYELRKKLNMKQDDVAKALSISRPTFSKYESGQHEPTFDILIELSKLFHASIDYMLGNSDSSGNPTLAAENGVCFRHDILKEQRTIRGKSTKAFSEFLKIDHGRYVEIEDGRLLPTLEEFVCIAKGLPWDAENLLGLSWVIAKEDLTSMEKSLVMLFRQFSDKDKELVFNMVEAAANSSVKVHDMNQPASAG